MSYFTASQIGKALAKARVSAGLSQAEIARRIEKGERTVQSWEKGCTSPDSDEIMDWCAACGVSPISVFMEMFHPDLYKVSDDGKADDVLNAELRRLVVKLPPLTKRLLLFILPFPACDRWGTRFAAAPRSGHSWQREMAANLHCPLNNRVSVCGTIIDQYTYAQIAGLDPCPDAPHPPIDDLKINYKAGRAAAENGAFGYIGQKKE